MKIDIIKHLNEKFNINLNFEQQKCVFHLNGPMLILAVPGAGKTTVMVSRIANLILNHFIEPHSILTVTFSKSSAKDMDKRFQKLFGKLIESKLHFSTIHSLSYSILKFYIHKNNLTFPIVIEGDSSYISKNSILKNLFKEINNTILNDDRLDDISNLISYIKNMMISSEDISKYSQGIENFEQIYVEYEKFKKINKMIDFDDMLVSAYILLKRDTQILEYFRKKYNFVNVDEGQDTSKIQHEILKLITYPKNNLFMVGDEDQCIYNFRGADPKELLSFKKNFKNAIITLLEENFRSTSNIVSSSNTFIKINNDRYNKNIFTNNEKGIPINYICFEEKIQQYEYIVKEIHSSKDSVVLFRNNLSSILLSDYLDRNNIKFYLRENKSYFFKHWVVKDLINILKFSQNQNDINSFSQIYSKLELYLSKSNLYDIIQISNTSQNTTNIFDIISENLFSNKYLKIKNAKNTFLKIQSYPPYKAIETFSTFFNYKEYLKITGKKLGYTFEGLYNIYTTFLILSKSYTNIDDFIKRIVELENLLSNSKNNYNNKDITLSTIHASKGLEYNRVFIIDLYENQFPTFSSILAKKDGLPEEYEEEVRIFYVGATRAINRLDLLTSKYVAGNLETSSRFIDLLLKNKDNFIQSKSPKNNTDKITHKFYIDSRVEHKKYGLGNVMSIDEKNNSIIIFFDQSISKKFNIDICIKKNLLKLI